LVPRCCYFLRCWNANSGDTGGIVADDWTQIEWGKVDYLIRLGLKPWFTRWVRVAALFSDG
jgi:hypothetical protein